MNTIVQKYGGTSVGTPERIFAVSKRIIQSRKKYKHIIVVISAMGKTTDNLIYLAKEITHTPHPREYDALLSTGETISASLLAMALNHQGVPAVSFSGFQAGIKTQGLHTRSKIVEVDTTRIKQALQEGKIVIVTGFQGYNELSDTTTIGRGGSDTSAVAIANAMKVPCCEIYTDVDGVYTTDPRMIHTATKLKEISYDEMLALSALGANVLHPASVEYAKNNNTVIHVRSSFSNQPGTLVKQKEGAEGPSRLITGVTLNERESAVSIRKFPYMSLNQFLRDCRQLNIQYDLNVERPNTLQTCDLSFSLHTNDVSLFQDTLKSTANLLGILPKHQVMPVSKVSLVGTQIPTRPQITSQLLTILNASQIKILSLMISDIKISFNIEAKHAVDALKTIHDGFGLNKDRP